MTDWTNLQQALSPPRLGRYLAAFGDDERKACDGYIHNMRLSEALVSPISILEITLRNALSREMANHYERANWYDGILADQELSGLHRSISDAKRDAKSVNHNKVIAEFSFGFWTTLLNARYQNQLWASLKYAFPHSPQKQRKPISKGINRVRVLRNRISHHEPILWLEPGVEAEYQHIYNVLSWINPGILDWTRNIDRFPDLLPVINSPVLIEQNS